MLNEANFPRRLVIGTGIVLVLLLTWQLVDLLLLVFASVLVAIFFRSLANVIAKQTAISPSWSLAIAVVLVAVFFGLITTLFGTTIRQNVSTLIEQLPAAWQAIRGRIGEVRWLVDAFDRAGQALLTSNMMSRIGGALGAVMGAFTNIFLVLFAGLYIAAQPGLYRSGFLKLVPPQDRPRIDATLVRCGVFLRNWLLGQLIAMVVVGTLTWAGLQLLQVPSALALGLFAGLAEFVPILGPIAAAIPALIIAFSQDSRLALWVLALFVVIQQLEGNVLQPIIQRRMVALPPAVTLFAVIAFAILFGAMGALLATPLAVVTLVLVQDLYIAPIEEAATARSNDSG
ncbi:MAG: AI-2E family transporter [Rhodoplanes sp.]